MGMTIPDDRSRLLELERRLSLAACAVNGLLHPNREHPPSPSTVCRLEDAARKRLEELRATLNALEA